MNQDLEAKLHHIVREWRRLAEAEGDAIRAGNWGLAQDCQREQAQLRCAVERLGSETEEEGRLQTDDEKPCQNWLRDQFASLIETETQNLAWVELHREKLTERLLAAEKSRGTLRKLRLSYLGGNSNGTLTPTTPSFLA